MTNNKICFNQNAFLIGIIIIIIFIQFFNKYFQNSCPPCHDKLIITKDNNDNIKQYTNKSNILNDLLKKRDYNALHDDLSAPTRRHPKHIYPTQPNDFINNIPTRGFPDNYHYLGNLIRNSDNKIVKLFGRQIYPGSNQYEYYGITTDNNGAEIKIKIDTNNNKELYDNDTIDIEFLDISKGSFKLFMNDFDRPRYNPFIHF